MAQNSVMPRRWFPANQPQTLQIAVGLLYLNAFFGLLTLAFAGGLGRIISGVLVLLEIFGGVGIANERKVGYGIALAAAVLPLLLVAVYGGAGILTLLFEIALVALLLHPMSRNYYKIWFR